MRVRTGARTYSYSLLKMVLTPWNGVLERYPRLKGSCYHPYTWKEALLKNIETIVLLM